MLEKYDLKKMLEEIKEDEKVSPKQQKLSQEEIKKMIAQMKIGKARKK